MQVREQLENAVAAATLGVQVAQDELAEAVASLAEYLLASDEAGWLSHDNDDDRSGGRRDCEI